jgi:hypothetical protein
MSSKQSMARLKSGTGVARVRENPVGREYARSAANFQRFMWPVPRFWTVPDGLNDGPEDETTIQIEGIGEDYICFRVRSGQAIKVICTPFSNIASISYLDMPK